jgi:hypothetical protein
MKQGRKTMSQGKAIMLFTTMAIVFVSGSQTLPLEKNTVDPCSRYSIGS